MTDGPVEQIAELLHQAGEVRHVVFADIDGAGDDCATFYADWWLCTENAPPPRFYVQP
jgi:hypothetical protein